MSLRAGASNKNNQMSTTHHGQKFPIVGSGSQVRNSLDKVISYDTTSLLDGIQEKENDKGRNSNRVHATVIPKLKRPVTSQISPAHRQSMNEQFNAKLIQHGTDVGVPQSELPDPSCTGLSKQSSLQQHSRLKL